MQHDQATIEQILKHQEALLRLLWADWGDAPVAQSLDLLGQLLREPEPSGLVGADPHQRALAALLTAWASAAASASPADQMPQRFASAGQWLGQLQGLIRQQRLDQAQQRVQSALDQGQLAEATEQLSQTLALDPENSQSQSLQQQLEQQRQQQTQAQVQDLCLQVQQALDQKALDQAASLLAQANKIIEDSDLLPPDELAGAEQNIAAARLLEQQEQVRQHLAQGQFDQAKAALERARALAADDPATEALAAELDKLRHPALEDLAQQARAKIAAGELNAAGQLIRQIQNAQADSPLVAELFDLVTRKKCSEQVQGMLDAAQALIASGELDTAASLLQEAHELDEQRQDVAHLLAQVSLQKKEAQIATLLQQARALLSRGQLNEALQKAKEAQFVDDRREETQALIVEISHARSSDSGVGEAIEVNEVDAEGAPEVFDAEIIEVEEEPKQAKGVSHKLTMSPRWADVSRDLKQQQSGVPAAEPAAIVSKAPFTYHWGVTTELDVPHGHPLPYAMDDSVRLLGLPVVRDVIIFYPSMFGEFPSRGVHEMFFRTSGYADWQNRIDDWLKRHERKLAIYLEKIFTKHVRFEGGPFRYGIIGRPGWNLLLEMTPNVPSANKDPLANDNDFQHDWEECVRAMNQPKWNLEFLQACGQEVPDRTECFDDLVLKVSTRRKTARKQILKASWAHFAKTFYLSTLKTCKRICPRILWGFQGYPTTPYVAGEMDQPKLEQSRQLNDSLQWFWEAADVLAPSFTATRYTVAADKEADPGAKENSVAEDRINVETGIKEALRLRDQYAPGKPVLSLHSCTYSAALGGGALNDCNLQHQLLLPGLSGASGIVITGHLTDENQRQGLQEEINKRVGGLIRSAASGTAAVS